MQGGQRERCASSASARSFESDPSMYSPSNSTHSAQCSRGFANVTFLKGWVEVRESYRNWTTWKRCPCLDVDSIILRRTRQVFRARPAGPGEDGFSRPEPSDPGH